MLARLVLNSWPQVICLPWPPKWLGLLVILTVLGNVSLSSFVNMKLGLPGTVTHRDLSFRCFKDQHKKITRTARPIWEISVFRMKTKLGLGSAHHTCNFMALECQAGWTVRSQIRDWPQPTQRYPLAINNIKTERNKKLCRARHVLTSEACTL